jgi:hypothetical protein
VKGLTLSQRESIYPPNLVDNKKIVHSYFVSINDNTIKNELFCCVCINDTKIKKLIYFINLFYQLIIIQIIVNYLTYLKMPEFYTIEVLFSKITQKQYDDVINYYNSKKPSDFLPLQLLDRAEGGFEIVVDTKSIYSSKQLRWHNKKLEPYPGYLSFDNDEILLLYLSLCDVFTESDIILHAVRV